MSKNRDCAGNPRRQVLVIGMLDSIHFARWLTQFRSEEIDFTIFPSKKFKRLHPHLKMLLTSRNHATFSLRPKSLFLNLVGYQDFIQNELPWKLGIKSTRPSKLRKVTNSHTFDFIHALEIQGAGYLVNSLPNKLRKKSKFILTNWGSDIIFFRQVPKHEEILKELLPKVDFYSAECFRDYKLAKELGFNGIELPCFPNGGGFKIDLPNNFVKPSQRNQVIIKGYGGLFGKADLALQVLHEISYHFPFLNFLIYSVTEDIELIIGEIHHDLRKRIRYSTQKKGMSHEELMNEFRLSRIYIGCSLSDGISTSFLESLVTGCYPIQTNTSCAGEWVARGAYGSIVGLDTSEICNAAIEALSNDEYVDSAAEANMRFAAKYLDEVEIRNQALKFYENTIL